jgi:hypothetical protein
MPVSEAEQLLLLLGQKVGERIFGAAVSKFITSPALGYLNLSDTSQQDFQRDVVARLDEIRDELRQVHASLAQISATIAELRTTVDRYGVSAALAGYFENAGVIESRYRFFVDGVRALAAPRGNHGKAAADIHARLAAPYDAIVSDAMDAVHRFVIPPQGVLGLFDHVLTWMRNEMTAFAQDGSNFPIENLSRATLVPPIEGGVFSTREMLAGSFETAADSLATFAVPLMKHVLATQIQGLVLLNRAWAGGPHDARLGDYVDNILRQVARMQPFFAQQASPVIREHAQALLRDHGRRLRTETLNDGKWYQLPVTTTGPERTLQHIRVPFDKDWVMWAEFPAISYWRITGRPYPPTSEQLAQWGKERRFPLVMLHRPWEGGVRRALLFTWDNRPTVRIRRNERVFPWTAGIRYINQEWQTMPAVGSYFTILPPPAFLKRTDITDFLSEHIGKIAIDADGQLGVKVDEFDGIPPVALTELLKDLPAKRAQLRA